MKEVLICTHLNGDDKPRVWLDDTKAYVSDVDIASNTSYAVVETSLGLNVVKVIGKGSVADDSPVKRKALAYINKELENGTN